MINPSDLAAFIGEHQAALDTTARPTMGFTVQDADDDDRLASKVGGAPYWPASAWGSTPYPTGANGEAMTLLAQVNCAQLNGQLPLWPRQGMLQFYVMGNDMYGCDLGEDQAQQNNFRVIYWPSTNEPSYATTVVESDSLPLDPTNPQRMQFDQQQTMAASPLSWEFDAIMGKGWMDRGTTFAAQRQLDEDEFMEALYDRIPTTGHRLGGHPYFTQEDPRTYMQDPERKTWQLLFQLDSVDDIMWGDAGVGNFFISDEDLARADFSRVLYNWDCC